MSQLTDYKEKYPQYTKGMSDDQVLERLHKSYYNSQDFEKFKADFTSDDNETATIADEDKEEEEVLDTFDEVVTETEESKLSED